MNYYQQVIDYDKNMESTRSSTNSGKITISYLRNTYNTILSEELAAKGISQNKARHFSITMPKRIELFTHSNMHIGYVCNLKFRKQTLEDAEGILSIMSSDMVHEYNILYEDTIKFLFKSVICDRINTYINNQKKKSKTLKNKRIANLKAIPYIAKANKILEEFSKAGFAVTNETYTPANFVNKSVGIETNAGTNTNIFVLYELYLPNNGAHVNTYMLSNIHKFVSIFDEMNIKQLYENMKDCIHEVQTAYSNKITAQNRADELTASYELLLRNIRLEIFQLNETITERYDHIRSIFNDAANTKK